MYWLYNLLKIEHSPHDYEAVLNKLSLQFLTDRQIALNKDFLLKHINGSIECPELFSKVSYKIPYVQVRSTYPFTRTHPFRREPFRR